MVINVLIADDHIRFRRTVADALEAAGIRVVAEAQNGDTAVELALERRPDVCLLDIRMPGDGIAAARRIAAALPATRILMLTVSAEGDDVLDALQAGATGYLLKGSSFDDIVNGVRAVAEGAAVIAPGVAPAVVDEIRRSRSRHLRSTRGESVQLTEREWHILELLDGDGSTRAIAAELYVAPVTVRSHIAALVRKLDARDRDEALALFRRQQADQPA